MSLVSPPSAATILALPLPPAGGTATCRRPRVTFPRRAARGGRTVAMPDNEPDGPSFEDVARALADEMNRAVERLSAIDLDDIAQAANEEASAHVAGSRIGERGSAAARARSRCSWDLTPPVVGHDLGHSAVAQMSEGVARESGPPRPRSASRTRKAPPSGAFRSAPKRTRTSTRLSRTRPSTWRVYQFRHRREGGGEYSPGCRTANGRAVSRAGSTGPCELSPSDGRSTVCEHMFAQVDQPAVKAI
jgi:hypothetical protein